MSIFLIFQRDFRSGSDRFRLLGLRSVTLTFCALILLGFPDQADPLGGRDPHLVLLNGEARHTAHLAHKVQVVAEDGVSGIPALVLGREVKGAAGQHPEPCARS